MERNIQGLPKSKGRYKRPFDLTLLIAAHILLAPVLLLLWVLISLVIWLEDRGPVFYRQVRVGQGSRLFTVLKFRTMSPDADRRGPAWTLEDDPRVTRVGRFLRRVALDELPETLSILKGDLSFVGPRALDTEEQYLMQQQIERFQERLQIRPGLTGLAQVYDHEDDAQVKLSYDLEYIQRMNPILDLKLLLLSVKNSLLRRWDRRAGKGWQAHREDQSVSR